MPPDTVKHEPPYNAYIFIAFNRKDGKIIKEGNFTSQKPTHDVTLVRDIEFELARADAELNMSDVSVQVRPF